SRQDSLTAADSTRADSVKRQRTDSLKQAGVTDSVKIDSILAADTLKDEDKPWPRRPPAAPRVANQAGLNMLAWNMRYPDAGALARGLIDRLGAIEGELYQVRNRSFQDPLNFPPKLVERISGLGFIAGGIDAAPTAQSDAVFRLFAPEIERQLLALKDVLTRDLRAVNAAFRGAGAASIVPKAAELRRPEPREVSLVR